MKTRVKIAKYMSMCICEENVIALSLPKTDDMGWKSYTLIRV